MPLLLPPLPPQTHNIPKQTPAPTQVSNSAHYSSHPSQSHTISYNPPANPFNRLAAQGGPTRSDNNTVVQHPSHTVQGRIGPHQVQLNTYNRNDPAQYSPAGATKTLSSQCLIGLHKETAGGPRLANQYLPSPSPSPAAPKRRLEDAADSSDAKRLRPERSDIFAPRMPKGVGFTADVGYSATYGQYQAPIEPSFTISSPHPSIPYAINGHPTGNNVQFKAIQQKKPQLSSPNRLPRSTYTIPSYLRPEPISWKGSHAPDNDFGIYYGSSSFIDPKVVNDQSGSPSSQVSDKANTPIRSNGQPRPNWINGPTDSPRRSYPVSGAQSIKLAPGLQERTARTTEPVQSINHQPRTILNTTSKSLASLPCQQIKSPISNQYKQPPLNLPQRPPGQEPEQWTKGGAIPVLSGSMTPRGYAGSSSGDRAISAPEIIIYRPPPGYEAHYSKSSGAAPTVPLREERQAKTAKLMRLAGGDMIPGWSIFAEFMTKGSVSSLAKS